MAIDGVRVWAPHTAYSKGERFQFKSIVYRVLQPFVTGIHFELDDSRYTVDNSIVGPVIAGLAINEHQHLIATYSDGSTTDVGLIGGGSASNDATHIERLVVTATNVLSVPTQPIDTTKPVKLTINHTVYASLEIPALFAVATNSITWQWTEDNGGFNLDPSDSVFVEYTRVP